jgi:hypothetical protein
MPGTLQAAMSACCPPMQKPLIPMRARRSPTAARGTRARRPGRPASAGRAAGASSGTPRPCRETPARPRGCRDRRRACRVPRPRSAGRRHDSARRARARPESGRARDGCPLPRASRGTLSGRRRHALRSRPRHSCPVSPVHQRVRQRPQVGGTATVDVVPVVWLPTLERAGLRRRAQYNVRDSFISIALSAGGDPGLGGHGLWHIGGDDLPALPHLDSGIRLDHRAGDTVGLARLLHSPNRIA